MEQVNRVVEAGTAASTAGSAYMQGKVFGMLFLAGSKAFLGILGVALMYLALPPGRAKDVPTTRREIALEVCVRMLCAGIFSILLGDFVVDLVNNIAPILSATKHPHPFYMAAGAPGWWVSRWFALQFYAWKDKTVGEVIDNVRNIRDGK